MIRPRICWPPSRRAPDRRRPVSDAGRGFLRRRGPGPPSRRRAREPSTSAAAGRTSPSATRPSSTSAQFTIETWFKRTGTGVGEHDGHRRDRELRPARDPRRRRGRGLATSTPTGSSASTTTGNVIAADFEDIGDPAPEPARTVRSAARPRSPTTSGTTPPPPIDGTTWASTSTATSRRRSRSRASTRAPTRSSAPRSAP